MKQSNQQSKHISQHSPGPAAMLAHADVKREHMTKLNRYKENLRIDGDRVISYATCVAIIDTVAGTIRELGTWSKTTTKHVNYVAFELGLKKV